MVLSNLYFWSARVEKGGRRYYTGLSGVENFDRQYVRNFGAV